MGTTRVRGVIARPCDDPDCYKIIHEMFCRDFNLGLSDNTEWFLSIDQSTSCTGIALKAFDNSFIVLLDVIRDKCAPKEEFFRDLHKLLIRIVRGHKFMIVTNELPVPTEKKKYARQVLTELLGRLDAWIDDMPELENVERGQILPQVWKSFVVDKSKGKGRSNDKSAIAADLVDRYPALKFYYDFEHTDDYDSFDALGILDGYLDYAYTEDGYPQIHGSKEKRHVSLVLYDWIDWDESNSYIDNVRNALGDNAGVFEPIALRFNERYSLHDNIRMASSNNPCVTTILPGNLLAPYQWKFGIDISEPNKRLMLIILRRGEFSTGFIKSAKSVYEWNEEVYSE